MAKNDYGNNFDKKIKRVFTLQRNKVDIDVIKCVCSSEYNQTIKYSNSLNTFKLIMSEEGIKGFYKGLASKAITQSLSTAVSWTAYETFKNILIPDRKAL